MLDPVASHIPWMVAAGNHEIEAGTTEGGPFAAYEHRFRMPSAAPAARSFECSAAGGGLDGNGGNSTGFCGPGLYDMVALEAFTEVSKVGVDDKGITQAALRAREGIVPFGGEVVTTGWPLREEGEGEGREGGAAAVAGEEAKRQKCAPSEWSGTYDYGNR